MHMVAPAKQWTVDAVRSLPDDGRRYELIDPSTARTDRIRKREDYQRAGVPEYWIVDNDAQVIERWRPGDTRPEIVAGTIQWHPAAAKEPLIIDLDRVFRN